MSDEEKIQINELIVAKRYEEAKEILRRSSDPAAKSWLQSLEQKFPSAGAVNQPIYTAAWSEPLNTASSRSKPFGTTSTQPERLNIVQTLGLPLTIVIFVSGWIVASQVKDPVFLLVGICGGMLVLILLGALVKNIKNWIAPKDNG